MKKIKLNQKLSLNKENVSVLNIAEQNNAKAGKAPISGHICGDSRGCVCTGSRVKTCGIYCPPDDVFEMGA